MTLRNVKINFTLVSCQHVFTTFCLAFCPILIILCVEGNDRKQRNRCFGIDKIPAMSRIISNTMKFFFVFPYISAFK